MCEICHGITSHSCGCPYYENEEPLQCHECGEYLNEYKEHCTIDGKILCSDCAEKEKEEQEKENAGTNYD